MAYVLSANMDMKVPDYKLEAAISKIFASVSASGGGQPCFPEGDEQWLWRLDLIPSG